MALLTPCVPLIVCLVWARKHVFVLQYSPRRGVGRGCPWRALAAACAAARQAGQSAGFKFHASSARRGLGITPTRPPLAGNGRSATVGMARSAVWLGYDTSNRQRQKRNRTHDRKLNLSSSGRRRTLRLPAAVPRKFTDMHAPTCRRRGRTAGSATSGPCRCMLRAVGACGAWAGSLSVSPVYIYIIVTSQRARSGCVCQIESAAAGLAGHITLPTQPPIARSAWPC